MNTPPKTPGTGTGSHDGLDAYRLTAPAEVAAMLHRLVQSDTLLNLNAPSGDVYTTTLWSADAERGVLSFAADAGAPQLQALLHCDEAVVVGYLDDIKIQFDVHHLVLVRSEHVSALSTTYPHEMFRFQRRSSYRVRPILREMPVARLRDPSQPGRQLALRILDVSIGGCALLLPEEASPFDPGTVFERVQIELDAQTSLVTALRLQHATPTQHGSHHVRLGMEMIHLDHDEERTLQRYIDQTQKRRRVLALE